MPKPCPICGKEFRRNADLVRHKKDTGHFTDEELQTRRTLGLETQ